MCWRNKAAFAAPMIGVALGWAAAAFAANLPTLTDEEANRPAEDWTLQQILDKGWTPYECFFEEAGGLRAVEGRRWPQNDPDATNQGACVTYSFMPNGLALEPGPPPEGPTTWFALMPAGSSAAVTAATGTWAATADLHFTQVADGGGAWNVAGAAGLRGNIRVASGNIPGGGVLAHGYYPPPNGVSAAGDIHFDDVWPWVTAGPAPGPPYDVRTVALHELGHALGLTHAGTVPAEVMFPSYTGIKLALGASDIGFITAIYGPAGHAAQCAGACCFSRTVCGDRTQANCATQGGFWRGVGTACPTQNVQTAQHASGPVVHWVDPSLDCYTAPLRDLTTSGCIDGLLIDAWMSADQPTCHNFGCCPESPPIPAGFFEAGSYQFEGTVCMHGVPLGPSSWGEYGEADTLIHRLGEPFDRCDLPGGPDVAVPIEIVALNLVSIEPITVTVMGLPTRWDVAVDLSQVPAPMGQMYVAKTHCNGGTYNSILPVQPRFTFTKIDGPGIPPGSVVVLDTGLEGIPPIQLQQFTNPPWTHDIDPMMGLATDGSRCTKTHPGVEDPSAGVDCDCNTNGVHDQCDVESGSSEDCNANGIPDECDPDLDGDGIPDDCDKCPDIPGALCVACSCQNARSAKTHGGGVGRIELAMGCSGGIEPRWSGGGVTELEIDLDDASGFGGGVTVTCTPTPYAGAVGSAVAGNTVTLTFTPGLPDRTACTIDLDCGASVCVRNLGGDANYSGITNSTDNAARKGLFGQTANAGNAQWDVNGDGTINSTDNAQSKGRFGNSAPVCP